MRVACEDGRGRLLLFLAAEKSVLSLATGEGSSWSERWEEHNVTSARLFSHVLCYGII